MNSGACSEVVQRLHTPSQMAMGKYRFTSMVQLDRFPLQALQGREEMYRRSYRNYVRTTTGDGCSVGEGNWRRHGSGRCCASRPGRPSCATHYLDFEPSKGVPTAKYTMSSNFHTYTISQCGRTRLGVTKARESASKSLDAWGLFWVRAHWQSSTAPSGSQ
jgi:hypothetical protein